MLTSLQVRLLRLIAPPIPKPLQTIYDGKSKVTMLFGADFLDSVRGLTVLDFGCGDGGEVVELAKAGAKLAIGLENRESILKLARERADREGISDRCHFTTTLQDPVDMVISLDCFEHFEDPDAVLSFVYGLLKPGGRLIASWGPPWYHPYGAHLIELPPWTHVVFSEKAVMLWRSYMRSDGATRYIECECGCNQMTIGRFERMVKKSGFQVKRLTLLPIRGLRRLHNRLTREFTTSVIQCELRRPD